MLKNELTLSEKLVMKCIWDSPKDMVLSEILSVVNERYNKTWKSQTVSTFLSHLVRKNFLEMTRNGKVYTYHPIEKIEDYRCQEMSNFVDFWANGSVVTFLGFFEHVGAEEQERLKKLLDRI